MEKRAVLAIILSVIVILGYDLLFTPKRKTEKIKQAVVQEHESNKTHDTQEPEITLQDFTQKPSLETQESQTFVLENNKFVLTFDSWGARLLKVALKDYLDKANKPVNIIKLNDVTPFYPLGLLTSDSKLELIKVKYDTKMQETSNESKIVFSKKLNNLEVRKIFIIEQDSYVVHLKVEWQNLSNEKIKLPAYSLIWEPNVYLNKKEDATDELRVVTKVNDDVRKLKLRKVKGTVYNQEYEDISEIEKDETVGWHAISSRYFLSAMIPLDVQVTSTLKKLESEGEKNQGRLLLNMPEETVLQNNTLSNNFEIYLGPKDISLLQALGRKMEDNIDFGFFGAFSKFLLFSLRYINRYVKNFGWSIVVLSILVKVLTYPLAHKSFVSMKKMQKVTPLVNEIRQKYKDNQQKVNQEIMALYKRHKVNPMGGCLPMVIQLPILFGLFNTLRTAIELRGEPFIFWLTDLSQKDPYYVLPVIMGLTMFLQQRMTPVTDPKQAKMMYFMPLVMTFMFLKLSCGLFIYFIVSNVLTIGQQYMINKKVT